ncbi:MAG: regulatory protein RecX [Rubrobacteraceae bacterium]|nr:RecX family transcriptional regulator [Rubrobacter sp.]
MPRVTGIRERQGRARVFVEGELWAEIDAGVAAERGLYKGATLSDGELEEARIAGERALAMGRALNLLGYRARSEGEIRDRLRRREFGEETIQSVVDRLRELGYVDDEEFARNVARQRARKYGPRRVTADLRKSGVNPETAQRAVEEEFADHSELDDALSAASRRYNTGGSDAEARRVYGFLTRRGYSADVCAEVARRYREAGSPEAGE